MPLIPRLTSQLPISLQSCWPVTLLQSYKYTGVKCLACTDLANKVDSDDDKFYKVGVSIAALFCVSRMTFFALLIQALPKAEKCTSPGPSLGNKEVGKFHCGILNCWTLNSSISY